MPTLPGIEILLQEAMILDLVDFSVGIKGVESSSPLISIFSSEDMYLTQTGGASFAKSFASVNFLRATESKIFEQIRTLRGYK